MNTQFFLNVPAVLLRQDLNTVPCRTSNDCLFNGWFYACKLLQKLVILNMEKNSVVYTDIPTILNFLQALFFSDFTWINPRSPVMSSRNIFWGSKSARTHLLTGANVQYLCNSPPKIHALSQLFHGIALECGKRMQLRGDEMPRGAALSRQPWKGIQPSFYGT